MIALHPTINVEKEIDKIIEKASKQTRKPVRLLDCSIDASQFVHPENSENHIIIAGAAGETSPDIPHQNLKTMTDPLKKQTRKELTIAACEDPVLTPALERRHDALFEDGYIITLELKSKTNSTTGEPLTPDEIKQHLTQYQQEYLAILQKIQEFDDTQNIKSLMATDNIASIVQGRAVCVITPGFSELESNQTPIAVTSINWEDLGEPILDISLTHKIVALNSTIPNKKLIRPDEMIYTIRKNWGLKKGESKWGTSSLEPILQISKTIKRIYNFNIPQAIIASYMAKVILKLSNIATLDDDTITKKLNSLLLSYLQNNIVFGTTEDVEVIPVKHEVDSSMLDINESKLADILLGVIGTPKSMLNREKNLNRDTATIELIQFLKFVRKKDEDIISQSYEEQLFNPLLSHLIGKPFKEIPVRIKIKSNTQDMIDTLSMQKEQEVKSQNIEPKTDPNKIAGAAGNEKKALDESEKRLDKILSDSMEKLSITLRQVLSSKDFQNSLQKHDATISNVLRDSIQKSYLESIQFISDSSHTPNTLSQTDLSNIDKIYSKTKNSLIKKMQYLKSKNIQQIQKNQINNAFRTIISAGITESINTAVVSLTDNDELNQKEQVFIFSTSGDDHVCPICEPLNGKEMSASKNNVEHPPLHDSCRCRLDLK